MTNIFLAFQHLEIILEENKNQKEIVVIFISDGGHNVNGDIFKLIKDLKGN